MLTRFGWARGQPCFLPVSAEGEITNCISNLPEDQSDDTLVSNLTLGLASSILLITIAILIRVFRHGTIRKYQVNRPTPSRRSAPADPTSLLQVIDPEDMDTNLDDDNSDPLALVSPTVFVNMRTGLPAPASVVIHGVSDRASSTWIQPSCRPGSKEGPGSIAAPPA